MIDFKKIVIAGMIALSGLMPVAAEPLKQYELNVNDFTELKVIGAINVVIIPIPIRPDSSRSSLPRPRLL